MEIVAVSGRACTSESPLTTTRVAPAIKDTDASFCARPVSSCADACVTNIKLNMATLVASNNILLLMSLLIPFPPL
jgi:hypothetical protein